MIQNGIGFFIEHSQYISHEHFSHKSLTIALPLVDYGEESSFYSILQPMNIYVIRNGKIFGPYEEQHLLTLVNQGKVLKHDKATLSDVVDSEDKNAVKTVDYYLKQNKLVAKVENNGNLFSQLTKIGSELIFPRTRLFSKEFLYDQRFLILAIVGFLPMILSNLPLGGGILFYAIAMYFSIMWGLFFYACFKTSQVDRKTTITIFFLTHVFVFAIFDLLGLNQLNPFYIFTESNSLIFRAIGFTFGVGLTEELVKMLPLIILLRRAKEPLIPRTMVFYGLISGIAFGVYEGVGYQMTINAQEAYDTSFFLNIMRLTSLPFLHACWCGIAGYFLSFASLYPKYRKSLYFLAITVPATIHGLYDTFSNFWLVSLFFVFIGLMLLTMYLKQSVNYQSKLRD